MDARVIVVLLVAFADILLGFIVFLQDRRSSINIAYSIFAASVALWGIGVGLFLETADATRADFLARLLYFAGGLIPATFYYFSLVFYSGKPVSSTVRFLVFIPSALFFFLYFYTDAIIAGAAINEGEEKIFLYGPFKYLFDLHLWVIFTLAFRDLLNKYKATPPGGPKTHTLFIILGTYSVLAVAALTNLLAPIYGRFDLIWIGPSATIIWICIVAYAVVRHQLFNIKVLAAELLVFLLWIFILIRTLISGTGEEQLINGGLLLAAIILGIVLIRSVTKEVEAREKIERLAQDLEKANVRLKELDQQKSEFVSIASHQLRSPLTAIKGYASMVLEGSFGAIEPKVREAISRIFESSRNLTAVVEDLLNVTKIEQGGMQFIFDKVDMKKLVEEIVGELTPNVGRAGLSLHIGDNGHKTYYVNADYVKIRQVVANLIDNAIKYTPKGGEISVFLSEDNEKGKTTFSVTDTGMGIEKEMQDRLFEKFSRASGISKVNTGGSGLGLYVAKEIVKAHGGLIWATSAGKGRGSTFSVELPEYDYHRQTEAAAHFAETL